MGKINWSRVFLGGLITGGLMDLGEFTTHHIFLQQAWQETMKGLGKSVDTGWGFVLNLLLSFLIGISAIWLYAAIRPRYGSGPLTALRAGFAMWIFIYLQVAIGYYAVKLFPTFLIVVATLVGLVEMLLGTLLGAWSYKEKTRFESEGAVGSLEIT